MKPNTANLLMKKAYEYAEQSPCKRKKVGCVIVADGDQDLSEIAFGFNKTHATEESCEVGDGNAPTLMHAEDVALRMFMTCATSSHGMIAFITTAPCKMCATRIIDAKIKTVYYSEPHKNNNGIDYLIEHNIEVIHLPGSYNNNN